MSDYTLYTYSLSSCSGRLRIAFNLKGIEWKPVYVDLQKNEQSTDSHREMNPSCFVPTIVCHRDGDLRIGQSIAALEYLDEKHPDVSPFLPADSKARTMVRILTNIQACDVQPVTNLRIMRRLRALNINADEWSIELINDGLRAYEATAKKCAGMYSVGDTVTTADICLMPTIWSSARFNLSLDPYPTVKKIVENLSKLPAFIDAHPSRQPDCPPQFRAAK
ncbi:hypothetical protein NQ176_g7249 [Zarea fungicola]|uniref:Uncharacterized protein n=1 Tax=Zarea fungicola TaxID=93591 RepID=A0ACC1N0A3_9HYPO|nr:hypothetical protein NQ176_g7249 [Lecanicillium fungicola]